MQISRRIFLERYLKMQMWKVVKLDVRTWSRHAFNPRSNSDTLVNNIAESLNAWILEAMDKLVLTVMEIIRVMLMQGLQTKEILITPIRKLIKRNRKGNMDNHLRLELKGVKHY